MTHPLPLSRGEGGMLFFFFDNLGFVWLFLILGAMRRRHTPPAPLERGDGESDLFV